MIIIAAMTKGMVIGKGNRLPWNIPEEFQHFLDTVKGNIALIGRKTYESCHECLNESYNIVLSRLLKQLPRAEVYNNLEQALEKAESYAKLHNCQLFSAGGSSVYRQTMSIADTMYLSYIKGDYSGDAYFPEFDENEWLITKREDHTRYEFVVYERNK